MTASVVLIDETTGRVVVTLEGVQTYTRQMDGRVTTRTVSDRSPQSDSAQRLPQRIEIDGSIATASVPDGYPVGPARVLQVRDALRALQLAGTAIVFAPDGDDLVGSMVVERVTTTRDVRSDPALSVSLVERRTASRRTIALSPLPAAPQGPARVDVASSLQFNFTGSPSSLELAEQANTSQLAGFGDFLGNFL